MARVSFTNHPHKYMTVTLPKVVDTFPWTVTREGEEITFTLGKDKSEKSEVHKTTDVRKFIINNFNWNGIVNMIHQLEEKSDRLESYETPTNLKGTAENDDILIIPDEALEAIIYEQAKYAIETKFKDKPEEHIDEILKFVDGKAKKGFAKDILSTTYEDLLKEEDNSEMSYDGKAFTMPDLKTVSETDLYDFLRSLTLSRNGLWLEDDEFKNLLSIRREMVTSTTEDTGFNDTLLLAWKENGVKKATKYIATTEPGKINKERGKLLPQTTTLFLGLHKFNTYKVQIPACRTINIYRKKKDSNSNEFSSDDDGINIHFSTVSGKKPKGLPTSYTSYGIGNNKGNVGYSNTELEAFLTVVEVYKVLSDWGDGMESDSLSCYKNLAKHTKSFTLSDVIGTTDTDKKLEVKEGETVEKTIMLSTFQAYISTNYSQKDKKSNALKLLMYYHNEQNDGVTEDSYKNISIEDITKKLKKDEVFHSIVKLQFENELNFSNVDGKPGAGTITKIERTEIQRNEDTKKFNDQKEKSGSEWDSLIEIFVTWDSNSKLTNTLKISLQTDLKIAKDERKGLTVEDIDSHGGLELSGNVGGWSHGCQVISGVQKFFHFMYDITQFVNSTNQERWYYTIVESSSLGITLD